MTDQARVLRDMVRSAGGRPRSRARVITVSSGKGGVGKTSLSVNLGVALVAQGRRVALVDADLGLANVDIVLGINSRYTLGHVLHGQRTFQEVLVNGPGGLQIVAGGSGVHELAEMSPWRLERFEQSLESLDSLFDVVIIDTGAGLGPNVLGFALSSPETIIVATPDPSSIADAYALIKAIAGQREDIRLLVAVNMVQSARQGEQTFQRLATVARRFLGVELEYVGAVPRDEAVVRAAQQQLAFVLDSPRSSAGRAVQAMAAQLVEGPQPRTEGMGGLIQRMLRWRR